MCILAAKKSLKQKVIKSCLDVCMNMGILKFNLNFADNLCSQYDGEVCHRD